MAKKLSINTATCDARNLTEEILSAYESITFNCASLLVSPESQKLITRYGAKVNCADVYTVPADGYVSTINGPFSLKPSTAVQEGICLIVNGPMDIAPGCEALLENYSCIQINGPLRYPESLSGYLAKFSVNGPVSAYPDDAVILKSNTVIDRYFPLRAKSKLYWTANRLVIVDPMLDGQKLVEKQIRFLARRILITESLVESMIECLDEQAELIILPDGTAVIRDDTELTDALLRKYGTRLYIIGDLTVTEDSEAALAQLEYLKVCGDATAPQHLQSALLEKADIDGVVTVRSEFLGRRISDQAITRISKWMLEQEENGIWVENCAIVRIDKDIPNALILDKLHIVECAAVECADEQIAALSMVSQNCACIGETDEAEEDPDTVKINSSSYTF